jgi:hypothetical protein
MIHKERIEIALPAAMMLSIAYMDVYGFDPGEEEKGRVKLNRMRALLENACMEPMVGLPAPMAKGLGRIIDKIQAEVMREYDQQRADKVAAAVYYFLKDLTDTGYLELWEGSAMAEAAALFLPMIEHVFEEEKLDESAQKQARRIMKALNEKGYYV